MIESLDSTIFYIISILIYISLIFYSSVIGVPAVRGYFENFIQIIKENLTKNQLLIKVVSIIEKIFGVIKLVFKKILYILFIISGFAGKIDYNLGKNDAKIIGDPINYFALILRKLYGEDLQTSIVFASAALVALYFILSII